MIKIIICKMVQDYKTTIIDFVNCYNMYPKQLQ